MLRRFSLLSTKNVRSLHAGAVAMSGRMAGKTVIVTGGGHGIAKATATVIAEEGGTVVIGDRDVEAGAEVARLLQELGFDAHFVETDVSNEAAVDNLTHAAAEIGNGKIDCLVNVAGVDIIAKLADTETARWDRVMDVNLKSVFFTCKAALPYLTAAGRSSIVNISSIQAARGFSGYPGYAATKAGIIGLTQQLAVDYASSGIRVNAVAPGPVVTDLGATSAALEPDFPAKGPAGAPDIAATSISPKAQLYPPFDPSPRLFTASHALDIAYPILWLASDEAAAITGTTLTVDGGFTIKGIASLAEGSDPALAATMAEPV